MTPSREWIEEVRARNRAQLGLGSMRTTVTPGSSPRAALLLLAAAAAAYLYWRRS